MLKFVISLGLVALALGSTVPDATTSEEFLGWSGRIVGGSTANPGQFPHQASLRTAGNGHFCGAVIINTRWVLSAAHCTVGRTTANTFVIVGAHQRLTGGTTMASSAVVNHPSYSGVTLNNDISCVQTAAVIGFSATVNQIAMASINHGGGVASTASGWGQTSHPGAAAGPLQFLHVTTLTNADCQSRHNLINGQRVFPSTICTFTQVGQGMCMGDSGGPLITGTGAAAQVIGLVSWGIACAQGFPDVYARVSFHRTWIAQITGS